jgi:hypothetical protein
VAKEASGKGRHLSGRQDVRRPPVYGRASLRPGGVHTEVHRRRSGRRQGLSRCPVLGLGPGQKAISELTRVSATQAWLVRLGRYGVEISTPDVSFAAQA